jgi:cardiolipin synthase (CMP-forming)
MLALPNILTVLRIALVPVFVLAFWLPGDAARWTAFAIFAIAGISDGLDGFIARKFDAGSDFGRMLDPIADKILVGVALMMLVADGRLDGWKLVPALVILSREILVSGLREFLAGARVGVPVTFLAKVKTTFQIIAIGAMILGPIADRVIPGAMTFAYVALWIAASLTVATGYAYLQAGLAHTRKVDRGLRSA